MGLRKLCEKHGRVVDVHLSKNLSKLGKRYAFVRFIKIDDVHSLIDNLRNIWIGSYKMFVSFVIRDRFGNLIKYRQQVPNRSNKVGSETNFKAPIVKMHYKGSHDTPSFASVVEPKLKSIISKPANKLIELVSGDYVVSSDECDKVCIRRVKEFASLPVLVDMRKAQGFPDLDIRYMGELEVQQTFRMDIIAEEVLIMIDESMFVIRVREVSGWVPSFKEKCVVTRDMEPSLEGDDIDLAEEEVNSIQSIQEEDALDNLQDSDLFSLSDLICKEAEKAKLQRMVKSKLDPRVPFNLEAEKKEDSVDDSLSHPSGYTNEYRDKKSFPMNCISINMQGIKNVDKGTWLRKLGNKHRVNFMAIQVTKVSSIDIAIVRSLWGNMYFNYLHSEVRGLSGGILVIWEPNLFIKQQIFVYSNYIAIHELWASKNVKTLMVSVYFPQDWAGKKQVWESLLLLFSRIEGEIVVMGDFNEVRDALERYPDHYPILLREEQVDYGPHPFHLFHSWMMLEGFDKLVKDSWEMPKRRQAAIRKAMKHGVWMVELNDVKAEFKDHFQSRFSKDGGVWPTILSDCFLKLSYNQISLDASFSCEEINKAVWDCGSDKALGPDGFTFGFFKKFWEIAWVKATLTSVRASMLLNGAPTEEFDIQRGLRHGDPLSPFLFVLAMEGFHVGILKACRANVFQGVSTGPSDIRIFHLLYADDVILLFPIIYQPPQETTIEILHDQENAITYAQTFLRKFNRYSFFETPKVLLLAWDRVFEIKDAFENKHYKPEDIQELFRQLFNDVQNIHEELAKYINTPSWNRPAICYNDDYDEDCTIAITPILSTLKPKDSLRIGDEHLDTIPEKESDEFIKSSFENLVPIPSKRIENRAKTENFVLDSIKFAHFSKSRQDPRKATSIPLERAWKNESNGSGPASRLDPMGWPMRGGAGGEGGDGVSNMLSRELIGVIIEKKCEEQGFDLKEDEVVPKVEDVSLVDGVFDGAFGGDGDEDFVIGEGVVVSSSLLDEEAWVEAMEKEGIE
nr:RNA-directed DNA polymerase, eukaryota [Tanacetum cinerariifolium]